LSLDLHSQVFLALLLWNRRSLRTPQTRASFGFLYEGSLLESCICGSCLDLSPLLASIVMWCLRCSVHGGQLAVRSGREHAAPVPDGKSRSCMQQRRSFGLCLQSLIFFFPTNMQAAAGMVATALYSWVVLLRQPYLRAIDDRLSLLAQVRLSS
jgi:hypothetical protein